MILFLIQHTQSLDLRVFIYFSFFLSLLLFMTFDDAKRRLNTDESRKKDTYTYTFTANICVRQKQRQMKNKEEKNRTKTHSHIHKCSLKFGKNNEKNKNKNAHTENKVEIRKNCFFSLLIQTPNLAEIFRFFSLDFFKHQVYRVSELVLDFILSLFDSG